MKFNIGDTVIITYPGSKYNGAIKEVINIDDDGWIKISLEGRLQWLPPDWAIHYEPEEQDELIEPVDLSNIIF